ncbi:MAG: hypothetical protein M1838_005228 [Thelocarpon superellum]|nr:MAG: hypothetical protein M1838_005228 [Thelocarpon superellum]
MPPPVTPRPGLLRAPRAPLVRRARCSAQARPFTQCHARRAAEIAPSGTREMRNIRNPEQVAKDQGQFPDEIGLLPYTFVMPARVNRPPLFAAWRDRWTLVWAQQKYRVMGLISLMLYRTKPKRRVKLQRRQIPPTAEALHLRMYNAVATADSNTLRLVCGPSLVNRLQARIHARGRAKVRWTLHRYTAPIKIMSHSALAFPTGAAGIRQAVVRVQSQQSLAHVARDGSVVPGTGHPKEIREYLVLQRVLRDGKEGPWKVWGTIEETNRM